MQTRKKRNTRNMIVSCHKIYRKVEACVLLLPLLACLRSVESFSHTRSPPAAPWSGLVATSIPATLSSTARWAKPTKVLEPEEVTTIQILMSDTGGGHRASANALRDAFDVLHPGRIKCDIVDIYTDYGPFWPYDDYVALYKFMAKYPITWEIFYNFGCTPFGLWLNEFLLETFCFEPFKECMARDSCGTSKRADMVISVHPLCQDIPLKILAELDSNGESRDMTARTTPFSTVVTDLGSAHPTWFNKGVDTCFVPSDALNQAARDRGLEPSQIVQYGLPIRRGFWSDVGSISKEEPSKPARRGFFGRNSVDETTQSEPKSALRSELGLDTDLPTVLVVGGGDGMGGLVSISEELGNQLGEMGGGEAAFQLVVVCGNNQAARQELESKSWGNGVKVSVQGFVNNMDEFMRASDALVTKAGPGTIAEASICGLPCMMFSYLPGQEEGNIPFVEDSGFGKYSGNPSEIAETVSSWLADAGKLKSLQDAALAAARPQATLDIARDLAEMAFDEKKKQLELRKEMQTQLQSA